MTTETDGLNYGQADLDEGTIDPQPLDPPTNTGRGELPGEIQQTPQPAVVPPDGDDEVKLLDVG